MVQHVHHRDRGIVGVRQDFPVACHHPGTVPAMGRHHVYGQLLQALDFGRVAGCVSRPVLENDEEFHIENLLESRNLIRLPSPTRKNSASRRSSNGATHKAHYSPPWSNTSIIGIAGSSGSGKTSLSHAIIQELSLPWVVIMSMDSFYKPLTSAESQAAFRNEYDFDAPEAIDFATLHERLQDIKQGKKADIPIYSFEKHARQEQTTTIYSPHVLILEGIFALHDERVLDMLDLKIFTEADGDLCLSRRRQLCRAALDGLVR
nr:uridine kinase [Quercus suber]